MRKRLSRAATFLLLLIVVVVGACGDDKVLDGEPLYVRTELVTYDDDTDLYAGEFMFVDLLLFNEADHDVTLEFPDSCPVGFEILQGKNIVVKYPNVCGGSPWQYDLRHIGVHAMGFAFSTIDEIPEASWYLDRPILPPGTYTLRAGLVIRRWAIPWAEMEFTVLGPTWPPGPGNSDGDKAMDAAGEPR